MTNKVKAEDFTIAKENKKNFKQSIIQRSNLTNEFTLADIENHQTQLDKMERELKSQISLTKAVIGNVERNHAFVAKMSDEQLSAAHYLFDNKKLLHDSEAKLKEVVKTKKNYKEVVDTIYKKFGFVESNLIEKDESGL